MLTKEKLLASIKAMPKAMPEDEFKDIDVSLKRIVTLEKVENGEKDILGGKIYSTQEARQELEKWLR